MKPLRVALLGEPGARSADELASALASAGHRVARIQATRVPPAEAVLRRRGFTAGLTRIPTATLALLRGRFDIAHAFSAVDAVAALAWRRMGGGPVVFTCTETFERASLANARLRLWTLERAFDHAQAALSADAAVRSSAEVWLAASPRVLAPSDAPAHERLYRELLGAPGSS